MRKLLPFLIFTFVFLQTTSAQDIDVGITAGYLNADGKLELGDVEVNLDAESGFYAGFVLDFSLSDRFGLRPEILYFNVDDSDAIFIPLLAKIGIFKGLHVQAGPQLGFALEDLPEDTSAVEIGFAAGLGLDVPGGFFVEGRYAFQLNNSYTGDLDITSRANYITLGAGYKF